MRLDLECMDTGIDPKSDAVTNKVFVKDGLQSSFSHTKQLAVLN